MTECAACIQEAAAEPVSRWKTPLLFVGALLFCPCHLPATFALVAAVGSGLGLAAFFTHKTLVYAAFGVLYLLFVFLLLRWFLRVRNRDQRVETLHAQHRPQE